LIEGQTFIVELTFLQEVSNELPWERDDFCFVNAPPESNRCASKIGLQVDHVRPVSFGQENRLENLRLLCRQCNIASAEEILGTAVMERYWWIKSRNGEEAAY
jgi:5-methylcytosine-specific restriction endonuclease McrA